MAQNLHLPDCPEPLRRLVLNTCGDVGETPFEPLPKGLNPAPRPERRQSGCPDRTPFRSQRLAIDPVRERLPLQQFHGYEGPSIDLIDFVDRADVRAVQGGRGFGFPLETRLRAKPQGYCRTKVPMITVAPATCPLNGLDQLVVGQSLSGYLGDRQSVEREDVVVDLPGGWGTWSTVPDEPVAVGALRVRRRAVQGML